jgi:hypothetical protein
MTSRALDMAGLLAVARLVLRQDLLPRLVGEDRFTAAMIANAMAIAARDAEFGADIRERERQALVAFYAAPTVTPLEPLLRRLARDLRKGRLAAADEPRLRALLEARARGRLEISNPDYLPGQR